MNAPTVRALAVAEWNVFRNLRLMALKDAHGGIVWTRWESSARDRSDLPRWRDGTLYWVVDGALIASTDKGESWKKLGDLKDGRFGPIFGKDGKHLFVLTGAGIVESMDGGQSWSKAIAPPSASCSELRHATIPSSPTWSTVCSTTRPLR